MQSRMEPMSRTGRISSRLARREQKKLVKQTLVFGGLAVVLLLAFLFVILPQSVRLISSLTSNGTGTPFDIEDTIPPQVPVLASPPGATPSAQLNLSGVGEPNSQVIILVNGSELTRQTIAEDGTFSLEIDLNDGENAITVYAVDANDNESATSQTYMVLRDNQPPKLEISEPQDGQQIELRKNQVVTIKGTTEPNTRVTVNGRLVFARSDGNFTTTYQLQEGENMLHIEAQDEAGNIQQQELTVNFRL